MYGNSNYLCKVPEISTSMECNQGTGLNKDRFGGLARKKFFRRKAQWECIPCKNSVSRIIQENKEKKIMQTCFANSAKEDVSVCESRANRSV